LDHAERKDLILHPDTVVRKGSLLGYGDMLPGNQEHAVIEVDALDIAQDLQFCAVQILELCSRYFRTSRRNRGTTHGRDSTHSERSRHP
jgi:hypothetical protein